MSKNTDLFRGALEVGAFGHPDDYQPTPGEEAMVVLNDSGCSFCNGAFDIDSGDAIAVYRSHWYHEACMLAGLERSVTVSPRGEAPQ